MNQGRIIQEALDRLEVETGYEEETASCPATYFAEIKYLGLKCSAFTEEDAISMVYADAEASLKQELSKAKDILFSEFKKKKKRSNS